MPFDEEEELEEEGPVPGAGAHAFLAFENPSYERFVNMLMRRGEKQIARRVLWDAFGRLRDAGHEPSSLFMRAIDNVRPVMEVRRRHPPSRPPGAAPRVVA